MSPKEKKELKKSEKGIHWNAMGAGLFTASLLYPEQQALLLSMGTSSIVMGFLDKREKRTQRAATQP